jgi:hypothetical protein
MRNNGHGEKLIVARKTFFVVLRMSAVLAERILLPTLSDFQLQVLLHGGLVSASLSNKAGQQVIRILVQANEMSEFV